MFCFWNHNVRLLAIELLTRRVLGASFRSVDTSRKFPYYILFVLFSSLGRRC